tara:strand:- start:5122 stop:6312 length:1191 start_codon:yes stop_codon:yes gene_type:complete
VFPRILQFARQRSFFLFGARNTGKSTLIDERFSEENTLWLDLLDPDLEYRFASDPNALAQIVLNLPAEIIYIVIDEVQKVPKLLDVVQSLMRQCDKFFIMTGSSARKLKRGGANLLAGRAFVYHLFPFSYLELNGHFKLSQALETGLLPEVIASETREEQDLFLQAYAHTYLKEEIAGEQLVRNLDPFRKFLEVAAQANGKIINFANIARDVGVDEKTVQNYFTILEDTLIGFYLEAYQNSFRKRLSKKPKFYFFDTGVVRALARMLSVPLQESTSGYGDAFEHFIILECYKLCKYLNPEYRLTYLSTTSGAEIDLVVERPGKPLLLIEIKSSTELKPEDLSKFIILSQEVPDAEAVCFCRDPFVKQFEHVRVVPWEQGVKTYFAQTLPAPESNNR